MAQLVSILIPAYNAGPWIAETVRSALAQTWPEKEIIVLDDGSTDETLAIVREFAQQGVTVVTQKNQGASAARNHALKLSRGDYIQWLDADDLLAPDKISRQMELINRGLSKKTLVSSAWGRFYFRPQRAIFSPSLLWQDCPPLEWLLSKFEHGIFMQPSVWLVSRELTEAAGPWDTRLTLDDDGEYFCRIVLASEQIRFVPEARVFYRNSGGASLSHIGRQSRKLDSQFLSIKLQISELRSREDSERVRRAGVKFLQCWMIYFYPERLDLFEQAQKLAAELGGVLEMPKLASFKYGLIHKLFGLTPAKRMQALVSNLKISLGKNWDKMWFELEKPARKHSA